MAISAGTRVLVASDDPKIRECARGALSKEGFFPILCGDGMEAMESLRERNPEAGPIRLIVLKAFLPKMDGFEIIRRMESDSVLEPENPAVLMLIQKGGGPWRGNAPIRLGADDYLEEPFDQEELRQKVHSMIKYSRPHKAPHPLTGLMGHPQMEDEIHHRIQRGESPSTLWIDINHFRSFNDHYGREQGNEVIRMTSHLISRLLPQPEGALAHVDGDDFALLIPKENADEARKKLREEFNDEIKNFYSREEIQQGFFHEKDRNQKERIFPLMALSTAYLAVSRENFIHYGQIVSSAQDLLRQAKHGAQESR